MNDMANTKRIMVGENLESFSKTSTSYLRIMYKSSSIENQHYYA
jgi:hypothetical protein